MSDISFFVGTFAKAVRTNRNEVIVFATNSTTTRGEVGYQRFVALNDAQKATVTSFIALVYGADECYIYSADGMEDILSDLAEQGEIGSTDTVHLLRAPYNFGL